ncbi:MAG: hypothetical protein ACRDRN_24235 [Sciscionella sp.]
MATKKVTLSLDTAALAFAERAARANGVSVSAWLSRAARREAVRDGCRSPQVDASAMATADEAERGAAEDDLRAAG